MQTAATTPPTPQPARRKDDLFGVCAAIGTDFGFNPDILRVLLTAGLLWNPAVILGSYAFAGAVLLLNRRLFPRPVAAAAKTTALPSARPSQPDYADIAALPLAA